MLIGEVARRSGVSARMLRHYDALGLVRPTGRTVGGYREYTGEDIRRILHVESLRSLGLSLRDVGRALDDPGFDPAGLIDDLIGRTRERITREKELLARLRLIDAAEPADWEEALGIVALLQALGSDSPKVRQRAALSSIGDAPVELLVEAALMEPDLNVAGALQWALRRSDGDALAVLAAALRPGDGGGGDDDDGGGGGGAGVRKRAVALIAQVPGDDATDLLRGALNDPDVGVRRAAALALGERGDAAAVPTLIDMVVDGVNDVDAGDALSRLARERDLADRIVAELVAQLGDDGAGTPVRTRIAQALADLPGAAATRALTELAGSDEPSIALTAAYVLQRREARDGPQPTS
ncbi:MerR family transcriptional regulator [Jiangella ureilytica]|uniref:MerR family transcriptional regulator n=1 Tax=Jiangella ureilytica TaxID=2530374 RepID=A0A4R4RFL9_9ACTN|nr:HEAT repeat domain-containing protein [Jiangella ureilytica]TDC48044.1 MerR family transcriptional regulator [Jiangella ureilytica]